MEYWNIKEASEAWNIREDNVLGLLENHYISGAVSENGEWRIPSDFRVPSLPKEKSDTFSQIEMTSYVSNPFLLNEEEKALLFAELDHIKGNFKASKKKCEEILKTASTESVKRGCYVTLCLVAMAEGDLYGWKKNITALKYSDSKTPSQNKEKELLMLKLKSNLYFAETADWVTNGEFNNLSLDSFPNARNLYIFNRIKNAEQVDMADFNFLLSETKAEGATYAAVYMSLLMASAYHYLADIEKATKLIRYALDYILKNHWIMPLISLRKSIGVLLDQEIRDRDEEFYKEYVALHKTFMDNWNRIYEFYKGEYPTKDLNLREEEIMFYIINGKSNAEIADILCLSVETIKTNVKNIFQKTGVLKRNELKDYMEENS